jgi:hypothetical protein
MKHVYEVLQQKEADVAHVRHEIESLKTVSSLLSDELSLKDARELLQQKEAEGWTDSERTQFRDCVSHISDRNRENTLQLSTDSYACLILEEQQHWMNLHPEAHGKKENDAKSRKCFAKHPLQIKGTPEEFHASYDLCMCAAYGLPKPK